MVTHQAATTPCSVACPKALPQTDLFVLSTSTRFCVCVSLFSLIFQTVPTGHFRPRAIPVHLAKHIESGEVGGNWGQIYLAFWEEKGAGMCRKLA